MAGKHAPERRHETLREKETGTIRTQVHPVDAKEMIASGSYEYVTDTADSSGAGSDDEETEVAPLPTVAKLPEALAAMTDVAAIVAMKERDQRATAQPLYDARLAELNPPTT